MEKEPNPQVNTEETDAVIIPASITEKAAELDEFAKGITINDLSSNSGQQEQTRGKFYVDSREVKSGEDRNGLKTKYDLYELKDLDRRSRREGMPDFEKKRFIEAIAKQINAMPDAIRDEYLNISSEEGRKAFYLKEAQRLEKERIEINAINKKKQDELLATQKKEEDLRQKKTLLERQGRVAEYLKDPEMAMRKFEEEMFWRDRQGKFEESFSFDRLREDRRALLKAMDPQDRNKLKPKFSDVKDADRSQKYAKRNRMGVPEFAVRVICLAEDFEAIGDKVAEETKVEAKADSVFMSEGVIAKEAKGPVRVNEMRKSNMAKPVTPKVSEMPKAEEPKKGFFGIGRLFGRK